MSIRSLREPLADNYLLRVHLMKFEWVARQLRASILRKPSAAAGFTLAEGLSVVAIIGVLMAMGAPTWLGLRNGHNLSTAQSEAYQMLQRAQTEADRTRLGWQVSFRTVNERVEASVHPANSLSGSWQMLPEGIRIDAAETTFALSNGIYQVQFDNANGRVNGQLGRITFIGKSGSSTRRCVMVSTLLGALRKGQNQTSPDAGGRYCY